MVLGRKFVGRNLGPGDTKLPPPQNLLKMHGYEPIGVLELVLHFLLGLIR